MPEAKRKIQWSSAWADARELVWAHRRRLMLGAGLMILNQAMGLVLPASTKYLIDVVIGKGRTDVLWKIALAAVAATIIQALTSLSLSQVLGVAAQRAITEMRKRVQAQISRLPISYFDSTQTGKLISRIMNDAEGIRNLVGTGLVQLAGSFITAAVAIGDLFIYVLFTGLMAMPLIQFAAIGTQITEAFAGLDRIHEVMEMPTEDEEDAARAPLPEVHGEIEFENVWFEYNEGVPVLKDVSFKAPTGSTTVLVGSSRSGKSTLISLPMNVNDALSELIRFDGSDQRMLRRRD